MLVVVAVVVFMGVNGSNISSVLLFWKRLLFKYWPSVLNLTYTASEFRTVSTPTYSTDISGRACVCVCYVQLCQISTAKFVWYINYRNQAEF